MKIIIEGTTRLYFVYVSFAYFSGIYGDNSSVNAQNFRSLNGKKVHFTGNSTQYLKFDVELPNMIDFALCLWYKPLIILDYNILFSYETNERQLIVWKIKKKRDKMVLVLKICDKVITEETLTNLIVGQWYHLCQYWHGSTGLWAVYLNNNIASFGYKRTVEKFTCFSNRTYSTVTVDNSRSKTVLNGEIYGLHLISTTFFKSPRVEFSSTNEAFRERRQITDGMRPTNADRKRPFTVIRGILRFIRQTVLFVTVPVFRFVGSLIRPWRRRVTLRPSSDPRPTTKNVNARRTVVFKPMPQNSSQNASVPIRTNGTTTTTTTTESIKIATEMLIDSIEVYEIESDIVELSESRHVENISKVGTTNFSSSNSSETLTTDKTASNNTRSVCYLIGSWLQENGRMKIDGINFVIPNTTTEKNNFIPDLKMHSSITRLFYNCCQFRNENVLISWDKTKISISNVTIEDAADCGNF